MKLFLPEDGTVWSEISSILKLGLRVSSASFGILFLKQNDALAAMIAGVDATKERLLLVSNLRLIRDRLDELIDRAEKEEISFDGEDNTFIRDDETKEYVKQPKKYKCPLCNDTGIIGVGKECICQYKDE